MDEKSLLATKQAETSKQFWDEALAKQKELDLTELEMKMAVLHVCGMPSWKTLETVLSEHEDLAPEMLPTHISGRRRFAENLLNRQKVKTFKSWVRERSQELYALNLREYDWSFKDSETELRYVLDTAKQQLEVGKVLTQDVASAILNSVKELNAMYKYNGNNFDVTKAKMVIFMGEDTLED